MSYCFHLHPLSGEAAIGPLAGNELPGAGEVTAVQKAAESKLPLWTANPGADSVGLSPVAAGKRLG